MLPVPAKLLVTFWLNFLIENKPPDTQTGCVMLLDFLCCTTKHCCLNDNCLACVIFVPLALWPNQPLCHRTHVWRVSQGPSWSDCEIRPRHYFLGRHSPNECEPSYLTLWLLCFAFLSENDVDFH